MKGLGKVLPVYVTRPWDAPRALIGQRIAIHAGRDTRDAARAQLPSFAEALGGRDTPLGVLLGTVELSASIRMDEAFIDGLSVRERAFGHFEPGRVAWRCQAPRMLHRPKPWKGAQQFWRLPADAVELSPVAPGQGTLL